MRRTTTDRDSNRVQSVTPRRKSLVRVLLVGIGTVAVILGTIGIFVPLLPTTPFLLLAGACFTRSSDRLYGWLIRHPWFGTYIRNYREHRAITLPTKVLAIALLWSTMAYTNLVVVTSWWIRVPLLIVTVGVTIHLLKLRTLRVARGEEPAHGSQSEGTQCARSEPGAGVEAETA